MQRLVCEHGKSQLWLIDGEWLLLGRETGMEGRERAVIDDKMAGFVLRTMLKENDRMAREARFWDELEASHNALVHPDGEPCPDGCGGN